MCCVCVSLQFGCLMHDLGKLEKVREHCILVGGVITCRHIVVVAAVVVIIVDADCC